MRIGVISDTHGKLRPEAVAQLEGSDLILHAGDVGVPEVLDGLAILAPVVAVRGNVDSGAWAEALPLWRRLEVAGVEIDLRHGHLVEPGLDLGVAVAIRGHSHRAQLRRQDGLLLLNPGSAGPKRFRLPVTLARLAIANGSVDAEIVELET